MVPVPARGRAPAAPQSSIVAAPVGNGPSDPPIIPVAPGTALEPGWPASDLPSRRNTGWGARPTAADVAAVDIAPIDPASLTPEQARARAIDAMVRWCLTDTSRLWLVEGGPNSGKTDLVAEVADRLTHQRWPCGWARPGLASYAVTAAARNGRPALVLVDDAETRADMFDLLATLANGGNPLGVRVIIAARDFGAWWADLHARLSPIERETLTANRTVIAGGRASPPTLRAVALNESTTDPRRRAVSTLATADPFTPAVLLQLAALIVALSTRVGQLGPAELRSALRDLFNEDEGFWRRTSDEITTSGRVTPALRSALACAAVLGADGLTDAATVLRRVPALAAGAAGRLARLAVWWHSLFPRQDEHAAAVPMLPSWLGERLPDGADSSGVSWTIAALEAERRVTAASGQLALNAHRDVWPSSCPSTADRDVIHRQVRHAVTAAAPVDEALAWLIHELTLTEDDLAALAEAIAYPTESLTRTAIVLGRRMLEFAEEPDERASLALGLGARHSEAGQWRQAHTFTAEAAADLRILADQDRDRYLPDLAIAVANLSSCQAHLGMRDEALAAAYEAVALHRELLEHDREQHLPALARTLTNLSACLSRAGRRPAALGAAGQAVAIYRELVALHPAAFAGELAAADHNWRICREELGQPVAGRSPEPG